MIESIMGFSYFHQPSKDELRAMLAEAIRNTEAKKLAACTAPTPVEPVHEIKAAERDWLDVSPPKARHTYCYREPLAYDFEYGSPEQIAALEKARKIQERAWFDKGYSREQVIDWMGPWPTQHGYPAYEWTAGYP